MEQKTTAAISLARNTFLMFILLLLNFVTFGQCSNLDFATIKSIWLSNDREDILIEKGFTKIPSSTGALSLHYGKCKKVLCNKDDQMSSNWNESFMMYPSGNGSYNTFDRSTYLKLKTLIKTKAKYFATRNYGSYDVIYYYDGKYYYGFSIIISDCLGSTINIFSMDLQTEKP